MDFASRLAARKAANTAASSGTTPPSVNPPTQQATPLAQEQAPAKQEAPAQAPAAATDSTGEFTNPPWANPDCSACKGAGFNSKGSPCRICDAKAAMLNRKPSSNYIIEATGDGAVMWQDKADDNVVGMSKLPNAPAVAPKADVKETPAAKPEPAPAAKIEPEQAPAKVEQPAPEPEQAPVQETAAPANKPGAGRPKKGFIMLIGCGVTRGDGRPGSGRYVYHLDEMLSDFGVQMAKEVGAATYYDIDAFKRRDAMASRAIPVIIEQIGADMISCPANPGPDLKAVMDALRPHAGTIVSALVQ